MTTNTQKIPSSERAKPSPQEILDRLFFALSDQTRRNILSKLINGDLPIGEIAEDYRISLPAISKHIRILEQAQLVQVKKEGRTRFVRVDLNNLQPIQIWLETLAEDIDTSSDFYDLLRTLSESTD